MPSTSLREFDRQLRAEVVPTLAAHGFTSDEKRIFRRTVQHEQTRSTQIIEFQIGLKGWSTGRFTVNLAVFNRDFLPASWSTPDGEPWPADCLSDLVQRLGFFREPDRRLMDRITGRHPVPRDHWWHQCENTHKMRKEIAEVTGILLTGGLHWIDSRTSLTAFSWALRQLERRKECKSAQGSTGKPQLFTVEPFPETR